MKTDIEKQFLKAYKFGGVVHDCIEVLRYRFNLGYMPNAYNNLIDLMKKHYDEILPNRIKVITEAFDESIITSYDSDLLNEISDNLLEYKTKQEKERYILTLIVPFNELSDLIYPKLAVKKRMLGMFDEQYERVEMISERFKEIMRNPKDEIEKTLSRFNKLKFMFADRLDALCLIHNIDFLDLQHKAGTYLILKRNIGNLSIYIGSLELTNYYIDKLPKKEEKQPPQLTKDLKTDVQKNPPPPKELTPEQIENLKKYFISQFKGIGNNTNDFEKLLIPDLNNIIKRQKAKECAMIAAIIYDCRYFKSTNKPTFNNWRNEFYNIMGIKTHTIYKKSVLEKENKYNELRKKFNYLNI